MTTTTQPEIARHAAAAELPPIAADAIKELISALGDKSPGSQVAVSTTDVSSARTALAEDLRQAVNNLGDLTRRQCEATLLTLAVVTLAEAHRLDHEPTHPPCRAARDVAGDLLRRHGPQLRRRPRRLLQAVVDAVATEGGRRPLVDEARALLGRARRWRPTCLNVDASMALRLGGVVVTYRTSRELDNGQRCLGTATLAPTNLEGRLVLLMGDGRAPESVHASVVSRVTGAVARVTNGIVKVVRDTRGRPCFVPALELTPRAMRMAKSVRSLHVRPRVKRKPAAKAAISPENSA